MSEENVQVVREIYEAAARHDRDAVLSLYDPEVEFDATGHPLTKLIGGRRAYHGHEGLQEFFHQRNEALEDVTDEVEELVDAGECVVTVWSARGRGRASGVEVELLHAGGLFTLRDGKVVQVRFFPTREDALKAAGLRA